MRTNVGDYDRLARFVFDPAVGGVLASDAVVATVGSVFPEFVPATRFSLPSFGAATLPLSCSSRRRCPSSSRSQQGTAFGLTQGAGSLGRTVGPPLMPPLYVVVYWSPFVRRRAGRPPDHRRPARRGAGNGRATGG